MIKAFIFTSVNVLNTSQVGVSPSTLANISIVCFLVFFMSTIVYGLRKRLSLADPLEMGLCSNTAFDRATKPARNHRSWGI